MHACHDPGCGKNKLASQHPACSKSSPTPQGASEPGSFVKCRKILAWKSLGVSMPGGRSRRTTCWPIRSDRWRRPACSRSACPARAQRSTATRAIAIAEQAIAAKTGLLGLASAFAARQMTARFFIGGFCQRRTSARHGCRAWRPARSAWRSRSPSPAPEPIRSICRPSAEPRGDGFVIRGRKAWVTNGPVADVFLVLAVTAVEDGRKRYGLFLIPKETPGLTIKPMPALDTLAPASHCELEFDGCEVPATARIGDMADAYPAMALPFRDVEDTVGTANISRTAELAAGKIRRPHRAHRTTMPCGSAASPVWCRWWTRRADSRWRRSTATDRMFRHG